MVDPLILAQVLKDELSRWISAELGAGRSVPVKALTVFTHPAVVLETEGASYPACVISKLRKQAAVPGGRLEPDTYEKLASGLESRTLG